MLTLLLYVLIVGLVAAVLFLLASAIFGRSEELGPLPEGTTATVLPAQGISGADVRSLRFQQVLRGYKAGEVDWALARLAARIDELQAELAVAHAGRAELSETNSRPHQHNDQPVAYSALPFTPGTYPTSIPQPRHIAREDAATPPMSAGSPGSSLPPAFPPPMSPHEAQIAQLDEQIAGLGEQSAQLSGQSAQLGEQAAELHRQAQSDPAARTELSARITRLNTESTRLDAKVARLDAEMARLIARTARLQALTASGAQATQLSDQAARMEVKAVTLDTTAAELETRAPEQAATGEATRNADSETQTRATVRTSETVAHKTDTARLPGTIPTDATRPSGTIPQVDTPADVDSTSRTDTPPDADAATEKTVRPAPLESRPGKHQ